MAKRKSNFAKIKVVGVGGSGGSIVNRMAKFKIPDVEFVAINTDAQALNNVTSHKRLRIGKNVTRGLGTGMNPELGQRAAEESRNEIKDMLAGADMAFITCGLGGGTGTGASPVVADIARDMGVLTLGFVTKPFTFEGRQRMVTAEQGLRELSGKVDTIITINNENLLSFVNKDVSLLNAFAIVDTVLHQGIQSIAEIITVPGLINVDFADVRTIMQGAGTALLGIGKAEGESRAMKAAKMAIENPLIDLDLKGAQGIVFIISGGPNLGMHEVNEAGKIIADFADPNAKIIFGTVLDDTLKDEVKITLVATGFSNIKDKKE
ncbi:MAG: cell division protein FtsZ, partial [Parcubacteria group bacterium]|nr:cell division protein FtsZ [Parcubacteria group bacterium]